jgi:hypothetical protein
MGRQFWDKLYINAAADVKNISNICILEIQKQKTS